MSYFLRGFRLFSSSRPAAKRRPHSFRPMIEALEDRQLLSTVALQLSPVSGIGSYAGVGFQERPVARLYASVNGQPDTNKGDFQAQIQWGDSQSSSGDLVYLGINGSYAEYLVKGSHIYDQANSDIPIVVQVTCQGTSKSLQTSNADVANMPSGIPGTVPAPTANSMAPADVGLQLSPVSGIGSYAGVGFQERVVATLYGSVNGQPDPNLSHFHAQINWGDSDSWSSGDLVYLGINGSYAQFLVKGSHIYAQPNTNVPIVVYVNGPDGTSISDDTSYADVAAMPSGIPGTPPAPTANSMAPADVGLQLSPASGISSYAGNRFENNVVATLYASVNRQPDQDPGHFQAQINWGDSDSWTAGDLVYVGINGSYAQFLVRGTHVYQQPNSYIPIVVYVNGPDGTSSSGRTSYATVAPNPNPIKMSSLSAPRWTANQPYSGSVQVSGGSGGYDKLEVTGLPGGLAATLLNGKITIDGTPTQTGTFNLAASLEDSNGQIASQTWSLTIDPAISLGGLKPTQWTLNHLGYSGTITINGGSGSYSNLQVTGLPAGLSASLSGNTIYIRGTPAQAGMFSLGVSVHDSTGAPGSETDSLTINPAVSLGSLSVTEWALNYSGYDGTIAVSGGTGGYSNLQVTGLPAGLSASLSAGTITLSGTPAQSGTFSIAISLQDSIGARGSQTYNLKIYASQLTLTPATLASASAGQSYSAAITASGGSGSYSFTLASGSLPSGLSLNSTGSLSGTATAAGAFSFTIMATDNAVPGLTGSQAYTLTVKAAAAASFAVSAPSQATAGTGFSVTITAYDRYGNMASGYSGAVTLQSSDGQYVYVSPAPVTLSNGSATATVKLKIAHTVTLSAVAGSIQGRSNSIIVGAAALASLTVQAPSNVTAGMPFGIAITGRDKYGNGCSGVVSLTSSDGQQVSPDSATLSNGFAFAIVTLERAGTVRLTASASAVSGTSGLITVAAAQVDSFVVSAPLWTNAGTAFRVTVSAQDAYANKVSTYTGTVMLTSSDGQPVTPASLVLTNGVASASVTLNTPGTVMLTASAGTISGNSVSISVLEKGQVPPSTGVYGTGQPTADSSTLRFQLQASYQQSAPVIRNAVSLFKKLAAVAGQVINWQVASYEYSAQKIDQGFGAVKNWLNHVLPAPTPGSGNAGLYLVDGVHAVADTLTDLVHQVTQVALRQAQPPNVQFAEIFKQAQISFSTGQKLGVYVSRHPKQALDGVIGWFNKQVQFAKDRPTYVVTSVVTNIGLALLTGGAGEGAATASAARNLTLLSEAELAAARQSLVSGARLEGHVEMLVGNSAIQAANQLQNL